MSFLILPTQLFEKKHLPRDVPKLGVILWECPWYFTNKKYRFNKKKLILHRASMLYYRDYLQKIGVTVKYVDYSTPFKPNGYRMFDPIDSIKLLGIRNPIIIESPNFLLDREHLKGASKTGKFFFNSFYMAGKRALNIIPDVKSQDAKNRKTLTMKAAKEIKVPQPKLSKTDIHYIQTARNQISRDMQFKDNPGDYDDFMFPVTHATAKRWLQHFIKIKLKDFGEHQDMIHSGEPFMYHSLMSVSMNVGLITPKHIIDTLVKYEGAMPLNSYEGFIRQLFWREYQRHTYIYADMKHNYFGNTGRLSKKWYGATGIDPVDDAIRTGFKTGYLHHINRLMVIGNYMNLSGIHPSQGFKWFMEFSCDSYEWVMHQNVYGMAFFADGGLTMRRPYISSSAYILRMSNYPKGEWSEKWNELYRKFIIKHKAKLAKFGYHYRQEK